MRRAATVVLSLALAGLAAASPPAAVAPVPAVVVPAYGTQYAPPRGHDDIVAELKSLAGKVDSLNERLDRIAAALEALAAGKAVLPAAAPKKIDPAAVVRAACVGCHTPQAADAKGGGFVMFADQAGQLAPLSARDRQRAASRVKAGSMPPPPAKLDTPSKTAAADYLSKGK